MPHPSPSPFLTTGKKSRRWICLKRLFGVLLGCLAVSRVDAGGGPSSTIVIYDPVDPNSVAIANYYQQLRDIPDINMVPWSFLKGTSATNVNYISAQLYIDSALALVQGIAGAISNRNLQAQINGMALAGNAPHYVYGPDNSFQRSSITSTLSHGPNLRTTNDIVSFAGGSFYNLTFRGSQYSSGNSNTWVTEIRRDAPFVSGIATNYYYVVTSLGHTGWRGNSAEEVFWALQRSKMADGAKPAGTVYWPTNSDIRSTTRAWEIADVTNEWNTLGVDFSIEPGIISTNKTGVPGSFPINQRAIIGEIVGHAIADPANSGSTYLPGAISDSLTSYGAVFYLSGQAKLDQYYRAGVAGTAGTITEPSANWTKFSHARIHSYYRAGASLGEAYYESIQRPYQTMVMGDLLTQPFADIPVVTISSPAAGATVSGTIALMASATCPLGVETNMDLFVDGRKIRIGDGTETVTASRMAGGFSLDTTTLSDGRHELRVVAYNATMVRSQGYAFRGVAANNLGMSVTLTAPTDLDRRSNGVFTVSVSGLSGATNVSIRSLGRTLADLPLSGGTTNLAGTLFGFFGTNTVYAVAALNNGKQVASAPQKVNLGWSMLAPTNAALNSNALAYVRYFRDTTAANFSWTNTPDATFFYTDSNTNGLAFGPNFPYTTGSVARVGHEFVTYFNAPTNGVYDVLVSGSGMNDKGLAIDGMLIFSNVAASVFAVSPVIATESLAAGLHEIRCRATGANQMTVAVRGGGLFLVNFLKDTQVLLSRAARDGVAPAPNSFAPNWAVNPPPALGAASFATPAPGLVVTNAGMLSVNLSNTPNATVTYFVDGAALGTTTAAPYAMAWSGVTNRVYSLQVAVTDGFFQSVTSATMSVTGAYVYVPQPTIGLTGGFYPTARYVVVDFADTNAVIHYTTDGRDPTAGDPVVAGGTILVDRNMILKVKAILGSVSSATVSALYRIGWGMIAAGELHGLALKADGTVAAWGANGGRQLGDGTTVNRTNAVLVIGSSNTVAIAGGGGHSLALLGDGTGRAWGLNGNGQLGDGTTITPTNLVQIRNLTNFTAIAGGNFGNLHSVALKDDGTVWTWGNNGYGQLGDGTTVQKTTPVQVSGLNSITAIAAGGSQSLAVKGDGTVWAWGYNAYGNLGDGTSGTNRTTAVQVIGLSNATAVAASGYFSMALRSNGTVWAWGYNGYGNLGDGTTVQKTTPVQVIGLSNATAIAAGVWHSLALRSNGTVWAWGNNTDGELGDGTTVHKAIPVQALGLSNVVGIAAGSKFSMALRNDGTIWAWGNNGNGQLGDGTLVNRSIPVQVIGVSITPPSLSPPPSLGILTPSNLSFTTNNSVSVTGTAGSSVGILRVSVNTNTVSTSNAYTNWTATVAGLLGGTNVLTVVATDLGSPSGATTNLLRVIYADATFSSMNDSRVVTNVVSGVTNLVTVTLPDAWKIQYFGTNFLNDARSDGNADPLGFGFPNWMKFIAGLDPLNRNDRFDFGTRQFEGNGSYTLRWNSKAGKVYQVQYSSDLKTWMDAGGTVTATSALTNWTDDGSQTGGSPNQQARRFYRVKVLP